jgi:molybdopterin converting factor subunit 1
MRITVRLFASLREHAGASELTLEVPAEATVAAATSHLAGQIPALAPALAQIACAVNRAYVQPSARLKDGDELALLPPVSGG